MTRPRAKHIKVFVTPAEREEIEQRAASANLSLSAFIRTAALNKPIRSIYDIQAVELLAKVHGDLGRVAGLLKLWLSEKRGEGAHPWDVESMMKRFRELQKQYLNIMGKITR